MIYVSPETGSHDLVAALRRLGMPVEETKLEFADVEFSGRGEHGKAAIIGIECKRLSEITGDWDRLAGHQVPKMTPEYTHRWVIVEGEWKTDRGGRLVKPSSWGGSKPHRGLNNGAMVRKRLLTLEMCGGVHVQNTNTRRETVEFIRDLYRWWTDENEDDHKAHIVHYQPRGVVKLTDYQQGFAGWRGVSTARAKALAKAFQNSIALAVGASVDELAEVMVVDAQGNPRRLGTAVARDLYKFLRGE